LQHRLYAVLNEQGGCSEGRHRHAGTRSVGYIDRISQSLERPHLVQDIVRTGGKPGRNFCGQDEYFIL
jgi:hypothetical protein